MFIDACAYIPMFILLTSYSTAGAEATRSEVELTADATLNTVVVDDLFGIRAVAPTSR
jgi:hypothetical protein